MHTHTLFCDGKDSIETMCRAAYERKLQAIGFSGHSPIFEKTGIITDSNISEEKIDEYVSQARRAKERWQGKLDVFTGLEVDYIKGLRSAQDSDIKALNLDYTIGSVHFIIPANGAQPFAIDGPRDEFEKGLAEGFNGDAQALMHSYYDAQEEMIAIGGFDILGHADIIKKNFKNKICWPAEEELIRQKEIAKSAARAGLVVEVNTGGINRGKINDVYPSLTFLRLLREHNIQVIITSDAHCADHIDGNYDYALQTLIYANFSEYVLLKQKNNEKIIWQKVKISQNIV
jgi:histidinol-phosphatase (PHP family)